MAIELEEKFREIWSGVEMVSQERFKEIWDGVEDDFLNAGQMGNDAWFDMCKELHRICEEQISHGVDIKAPETNAPMSDERHLMFIEGAKWGYRHASERWKEKTNFENKNIRTIKK